MADIPEAGLAQKKRRIFVQGTNADTGAVAGDFALWNARSGFDWQDFGAVDGTSCFASSSAAADQARTFSVVGIAGGKLVKKQFTLNGASGQTEISIPSGAPGNGWDQILDVIWDDVNNDAAGNIFVYSVTGNTAGVPNDLNSLRGKIDIGEQRARMAVFEVPVGYKARLLRWFGAASDGRLRLRVNRRGSALGFETVDEHDAAGGPLDRGLPPDDPRFSLAAGALVKMTLDTDTAATSTAAGGYEVLLLKDE